MPDNKYYTNMCPQSVLSNVALKWQALLYECPAGGIWGWGFFFNWDTLDAMICNPQFHIRYIWLASHFEEHYW